MNSVSVEHIAIDDRGIARIAGRRTKVIHLLMDKQVQVWTPEQIAEQYPHLSLAEVHAAFAYYYDHREELDEQIGRDVEEADRARTEAGESPVAKRLREAGKLP